LPVKKRLRRNGNKKIKIGISIEERLLYAASSEDIKQRVQKRNR